MALSTARRRRRRIGWADLTTPEIQARDAVIGAIQLANTKKLPIVVIDRDNIWKPEWGELWRYEEEGEEEGDSDGA